MLEAAGRLTAYVSRAAALHWTSANVVPVKPSRNTMAADPGKAIVPASVNDVVLHVDPRELSVEERLAQV